MCVFCCQLAVVGGPGSLRWTLFDASKYSFGILIFCNYISNVLLTEPPSSQGHIGLSINLNLWRYDFVFPWPETIVVNSDVIDIFSYSLCSTVGKNDLHSAPLSVLSHCLCHFVSHSFFSLVAIVVIGMLLYTMFSSPSSSAASLASLSACSFLSIPLCAFTHLKWIDQFCVMSCRTLCRISSIKGLCIKLFLSEAKVILLSVYLATVLALWSERDVSSSSDFKIAICLASLFEQQFCSLYLHCFFSTWSTYVVHGRSCSKFSSDFASVCIDLCGVLC